MTRNSELFGFTCSGGLLSWMFSVYIQIVYIEFKNTYIYDNDFFFCVCLLFVGLRILYILVCEDLFRSNILFNKVWPAVFVYGRCVYLTSALNFILFHLFMLCWRYVIAIFAPFGLISISWFVFFCFVCYFDDIHMNNI